MLWMALPNSDALAIGPTSNGINSHDKVFIFNMSEVGPRSGVDLV